MEKLHMSQGEIRLAQDVKLKELQHSYSSIPEEKIHPAMDAWFWVPQDLKDFHYLSFDLRQTCIQHLIFNARINQERIEGLTKAFRLSESLSREDFLSSFELVLAYYELESASSTCVSSLSRSIEYLSTCLSESVDAQARLTFKINQRIGYYTNERRLLLALALYLERLNQLTDNTKIIPTAVIAGHVYQVGEYIITWNYDIHNQVTRNFVRVATILDPLATYTEVLVTTVPDAEKRFGLPTIIDIFAEDKHGTELVSQCHILPWTVFDYYQDKPALLEEHCHLTNSPQLATLLDYFKQQRIIRPQ